MILNGVDEKIKEKGLTRTLVAEKLSVTNTSLSRYINLEREPPLSVLLDLSELLELSIDYMLGAKNQNDVLPPDEMKLLRTYRGLDEEGQEIVRATANLQKQRCAEIINQTAV